MVATWYQRMGVWFLCSHLDFCWSPVEWMSVFTILSALGSGFPGTLVELPHLLMAMVLLTFSLSLSIPVLGFFQPLGPLDPFSFSVEISANYM